MPQRFKLQDNKLHIPKLKSGITYVVSKKLIGEPCFATVTKSKSSKYYVSITVKLDSIKATGKEATIELEVLQD